MTSPYLPADTLVVKMIAMQGYTDEEMERIFELPEGQIARWESIYPGFKASIAEGRSVADAQVVAALYKNCVGYTKRKDVIVGAGSNAQKVTLEEDVAGDVNAQKFWLQSRSPQFRPQPTTHLIQKSSNNPYIEQQETKQQLVSSILALISPADAPLEGEWQRVDEAEVLDQK